MVDPNSREGTSTLTYSYPEGENFPTGSPWPVPILDNPYKFPVNITDEMIDKIWEKMSLRKIILYCRWCGAANAFDNPTCVQCGGPPG